MRVIVAGSRGVSDYEKVSGAIASSGFDVSEIVSGGARGVDALGERYARESGLPLKVFRAEWEKHGRSAGIKRNILMAQNADAIVAVWDGESRGTEHMIDEARRSGLLMHVENVGSRRK